MTSRSWSLVLVLLASACAQGGQMRRDAGGPSPQVDAGAPDDAMVFDTGPPDVDGGPPIDPPPVDAGELPDAGPEPVDAGAIDAGPVPGPGAYLDRCTADTDCASLRCTRDLGGTSFCTRTCSSDANCAEEHACISGVCVADDTGAPCSTGAPAACAHGLCLGNSTSGTAGLCTRRCSTALDCPSGHACTDIGGERVCAEVERPCASGEACSTGLCFGDVGCTATCRTAADCPQRLTSIGVPPYTCEYVASVGTSVCMPPADITGPQPIGASCSASGTVGCRSGACDTSAPLGPMCTQACTSQGGCAPGLGCQPIDDGEGGFLLTCQRAGTRDLGAPCGSARDCRSALCDATGFCTRMCNDGMCPSGMVCQPVPGAGIAICRR